MGRHWLSSTEQRRGTNGNGNLDSCVFQLSEEREGDKEKGELNMSDEMAEKKAQEEQHQKTDQEKAQEEANKRLWALQLVLDPVTGQFAMIPNENVRTRQQVDALLAAATNNSLIGAVAMQILAVLGQSKPKSGGGFGKLFRGR